MVTMIGSCQANTTETNSVRLKSTTKPILVLARNPSFPFVILSAALTKDNRQDKPPSYSVQAFSIAAPTNPSLSPLLRIELQMNDKKNYLKFLGKHLFVVK